MLEAFSMMGEADYGPTNITRERSVKTVLQLMVLQLMLSEGKNQLDLKVDEIPLSRMRHKLSPTIKRLSSTYGARPRTQSDLSLLLYGDLRSAEESGSEIFRNSILIGHSV
jgi:hypothetical protein